MAEMVRTHVLLPRKLVEEFDRRVGGRKRSERVAELMAEFVRRERQKEVFGRLSGFVKDEDHPEWATAEGVAEWVRKLREEAWERPSYDDSLLPED